MDNKQTTSKENNVLKELASVKACLISQGQTLTASKINEVMSYIITYHE